MTKTLPRRKVQVCDFCGSDGFLQTCLCCSKDFCLVCEGIVEGCFVTPRICQKCDDNACIRELCREYSKPIAKLVRQRDKRISRVKPE